MGEAENLMPDEDKPVPEAEISHLIPYFCCSSAEILQTMLSSGKLSGQFADIPGRSDSPVLSQNSADFVK